jgi:hypothetical protein
VCTLSNLAGGQNGWRIRVAAEAGRDELVLGIAGLDKRVDALTSVMKEILIVLSDVKEIVQRLDR